MGEDSHDDVSGFRISLTLHRFEGIRKKIRYIQCTKLSIFVLVRINYQDLFHSHVLPPLFLCVFGVVIENAKE